MRLLSIIFVFVISTAFASESDLAKRVESLEKRMRLMETRLAKLADGKPLTAIEETQIKEISIDDVLDRIEEHGKKMKDRSLTSIKVETERADMAAFFSEANIVAKIKIVNVIRYGSGYRIESEIPNKKFKEIVYLMAKTDDKKFVNFKRGDSVQVKFSFKKLMERNVPVRIGSRIIVNASTVVTYEESKKVSSKTTNKNTKVPVSYKPKKVERKLNFIVHLANGGKLKVSEINKTKDKNKKEFVCVTGMKVVLNKEDVAVDENGKVRIEKVN
jgi:hypothetical protein